MSQMQSLHGIVRAMTLVQKRYLLKINYKFLAENFRIHNRDLLNTLMLMMNSLKSLKINITNYKI
ncbi:hypothetical protein TTHERM_000035711 (macronuclear) [Tetrahymena thermophila SB210]|uniref:Uncharacterized protein n=1 Tax=Tetrahymena thermophila (strain SB210) TaxID=312017 RepID=W7X694_TETTS|nr:hypothetical protein TTHERM_000035711 [Tetrahymena thermophila SB210]EWS74885.1 hypothetical protein TTHERM_000035711 [Tetrahymena thermophila SB210]|eukprot:XP_012652598.1 hypothetical protein TTHERM_000035711 [Tetrahymena thermophila SB210]